MQRRTKQRQAVCRAFENAGRPLTVAEAHEAAREHAPSIGAATVYRAVNALVQEGDLCAVEIPGEPARYEKTGTEQHHHFSCRGCGRVFDVQGRGGGMETIAPEGFEVERHEVILYGTCGECCDKAARDRG